MRDGAPGSFSGLYAPGGVWTLPPLAAPMPGRFIQVVNRDMVDHLDSMEAYLGLGGTHWFVISNVFA